jgi:ribosome maturation protein Sdo1
MVIVYPHNIVDYKRKKEAKKEKVIVVAFLFNNINANLKDTNR